MSASPGRAGQFLRSAGLAAGLFSGLYFLLTAWLLRRWLRPDVSAPSVRLEPVTFFRPLKPGEQGVEDSLERFLAAVGPEDQVLFGAEDDGARRIVQSLAARHPDLDIGFPEIRPGRRANPKVAKLEQLEPLARHERWIVLDSDSRADAGFLHAFRSEWAASGADAFSAPYVFAATDGLSSALDAAGTELALWPGAALLRATGRLEFLTGACMAVRASILRRLGGWKVLGEALADDHELGLAVARAGGRVGISRCVVTLAPPSPGLKPWLLHQHRAYATFRLCNPAGSLGLPLTFGVAWSAIALLRNPLALSRWALHLAILACRCAVACSLPGRRRPVGVVWLTALAEPAFWGLSLLPFPVWWAGRWIAPRKPPACGKPSCQRAE